ncbi:hypothetical protein PIB30_090191 [Stylosanthes scabra]|uniref:Uncharacterized protein n=1 Tax=Stylosanthes scabra TaxID=79078 RepID=A0ABU6VSN3_9FABA|nr:hypothetical protein [Stylosanthes scabra]
MDGPRPEKVNSQNSLHLVKSVAVARARHVFVLEVTKQGGAGAPSGSCGRATNGNFLFMQGRARARGQRWIGLFLAFCPFSLLSLFFLASLGLFLYTLGLKFNSTHIDVTKPYVTIRQVNRIK